MKMDIVVKIVELVLFQKREQKNVENVLLEKEQMKKEDCQ